MRTRPPTPPGGILKRHYLEPLNLTVSELAKSLGVSRKTLSRIVNEHGSITPDMALRLSKASSTTPQLWLICSKTMIYGMFPKNFVNRKWPKQ